MQNNGWKGDPVDVVEMPDSKLTSVDNTRVLKAKVTDTKIEAKVRKFDEPLDDVAIIRFRDKKKGQEPETWGEAITDRINNQSKKFKEQNPNGTHDLPKITGKTKDK